MRSFFAGHRSSRRRSEDEANAPQGSVDPNSTKPQAERFNRLLSLLFPDTTLPSRPRSTAPVPSHPQPLLQRPTVAQASRPSTARSAAEMPHSASASAANADLPLDIILHSDPIILRGTGVDIEPGIIRGTVKLSLPEATDIKVIDIRCTGKSRVVVMLKEGTRSQAQTTIYYIKDIGLLEGSKSIPHTLKAGTHEFPFTFEIDAKSAASLTANFGMATIDWKLRATAVRPSFSTNFTATKELAVVRSFGPESLEFQQTLEIENVWPEKINYAVILPHKAWAAGDTISAILKFTPLVKGVKVVSVKMSLQEKVKTVWKALSYEDIRVVCSKKEALRRSRRRSSTGSPDATALQQQQQRQPPSATTPSFFRRVGSRVQSRENLLGLFRTRTGEEGPASEQPATPPVPSPGSESPERRSSSEEGGDDSEEVEMVIRMHVPTGATPSHSIAPVIVSHRVKWDVLISNPDGHYSELRCSLPVHILAKEVLEETLSATNATRTALLGESHGVQVQEIVLPAYHDHLRDRVAIAELHDHALATNPLNNTSIPTSPEDEPAEVPNPVSSSYNPASTLAEQMGRSNVPRVASVPDASERGRMRRSLGFNAPADAHSSELYLSLGRRPDTANTTPPDAGSHPASQSSSRASSPERSGEPSASSGGRSRHAFMRPFTAFTKSSNKAPSTPSSSRPNSRPGSSHKNPSAWHRQTLSRESSGPSTPSSPDNNLSSLPTSQSASRGSASPTGVASSLSLGEYYDAVPEYAFAARGFLGGGITPLSSFRGLPSYDQAQRSRASSPQSSSVGMTSIASTASAASQGSSTSSGSGGSRRKGGLRGGRRTSMAGEQRPPVPPLPPLPPSPTPSR